MKHIFSFLALVLFSICSNVSYSQIISAPDDCEDFDDLSAGNWTEDHCNITMHFGPNRDGYLRATDDVGDSWITNTYYNHDIITCGEICYDYRLVNDGNPGTGSANIQIRIFRNSVNGSNSVNATFLLTNPIQEGSGWQTICVPLETISTGSPLPSNQFGNWVMNTTPTAANWNNLISSFHGVAFKVDMVGSSEQLEIFDIDNFCITEKVCCAVNPSSNFSINTTCSLGQSYNINVTATNPEIPNHTWQLMQTVLPNQTTGGTQVGATLTGTAATFNVLNASDYYYVIHRVWQEECFEPLESKFAVPYYQLSNVFRFENEQGQFQSAFCYGADVFLNGTFSIGEDNYFIGIMRRPLSPANQPYTYYDQRYWAGSSIGLINLSQLFANPDPNSSTNGIKYFEPGYEYKVGVALQNTAACVNWVLEEKSFTVECCPGFLSAAFDIDPTPIEGTNKTKLEAVFFEHYENYGTVKHEWFLISSPNQNGGPYSLVSRVSGPEFAEVVEDGQCYILIHHIKTTCGDYCFGRSVCIDGGGERTEVLCDLCGELDCSIVEDICTAAPTNLDGDCLPFWPLPAERLSWDPVSGAGGGYFVEVTYNDPACCTSEYGSFNITYKVTNNFFDINTVPQPVWDCLRWRVAAICESEILVWSDYQCFAGCNRNGERSDENTSPTVTDDVSIAPNPAGHFVDLRFAMPFTGTVMLTDAMGRKISAINLTDQSNTRFDLQNLPAGVYQISTQDATQRKVYQLVKQ